MKNSYMIAALVITMCMSGCVSLPFSSNLAKIVEGMSRDEVNELLGNPTHRRFDPGFEEWEYVRAHSAEENRIVLIDFIDGSVSGMDSFYAPISNLPQGPRTGNSHRRGENPRH